MFGLFINCNVYSNNDVGYIFNKKDFFLKAVLVQEKAAKRWHCTLYGDFNFGFINEYDVVTAGLWKKTADELKAEVDSFLRDLSLTAQANYYLCLSRYSIETKSDFFWQQVFPKIVVAYQKAPGYKTRGMCYFSLTDDHKKVYDDFVEEVVKRFLRAVDEASLEGSMKPKL